MSKMDQLSFSGNNKHNHEEGNKAETLNEVVASCRSLSYYDGKTFKTLLPQITAAVIAAGFHVVLGLSFAFSAIMIPDLTRNITLSQNDSGEITATKAESSWIASVIVLINPFSAIIAGFIMDAVGRLNLLRLSAAPTIIGWILIATAVNVPMLIIGRLFVGFGSTWGTSPAIVYITEIARKDMRGSLISLGPTFVSLGTVICFFKSLICHWRTVAWISNVYVIIAVGLTFLIPESPAWLVSKGRVSQALKSLEWINKYQPQPGNRNESLAELELQRFQREHQEKLEMMRRQGQNGSLGKLKEILKPTGYKPLLILCGLFFFQQFSGIYITLFYSVTFFEEARVKMDAYLASAIIAVVRLVMSFINNYSLKSFSRRPLLILSCVGMAICMGFSGLWTYWLKTGKSDQFWVPVFLILLYVMTSMMGLLSIPWTMTAELFPIEIRGVAHSISFGVGHLLMFASVQSYWTLNTFFGGAEGLQWFFAVIAIIASIYILVFLPETHGRKLNEITQYFQHNTIYLLSVKRRKTSKDNLGKQIKSRNDIKTNDKQDQEQNQKLMNEL